MEDAAELSAEVVATGLGWPEGPTVLSDSRVVIVESYRSQLTAIGLDGSARQFAYVAGAPNACVLGSDGRMYVCQNGGTTGPWRAAEMTTPSIQRVAEGGKAEIILTEIAGIRLNGPNDLVFAADGRLGDADHLGEIPDRGVPAQADVVQDAAAAFRDQHRSAFGIGVTIRRVRAAAQGSASAVLAERITSRKW